MARIRFFFLKSPKNSSFDMLAFLKIMIRIRISPKFMTAILLRTYQKIAHEIAEGFTPETSQPGMKNSAAFV